MPSRPRIPTRSFLPFRSPVCVIKVPVQEISASCLWCNPCMFAGGPVHRFHYGAAGGGFLRGHQRYTLFAVDRVEEQLKGVRPAFGQIDPGRFTSGPLDMLALEIELIAVDHVGVALSAAENDTHRMGDIDPASAQAADDAAGEPDERLAGFVQI